MLIELTRTDGTVVDVNPSFIVLASPAAADPRKESSARTLLVLDCTRTPTLEIRETLTELFRLVNAPKDVDVRVVAQM